MSLSTILFKLSRLGLLSVFCAGLFIASGELRMSPTRDIQIGSGGIYSAMAAIEATTPAAPVKKDTVDTTVDALVTFMNLGIGALTFLITPLIMLAGWLLSPDWTFGDIFNLRPILHSLWRLISNVVYVIFGFMLVFVAFANIFGGENSKAYEMKTILPKLVTGMLIVPFTWFIVSEVLTISNVLTASVIQLPVSIITSAGATAGILGGKIIPKTIMYYKGGNFGKGTKTSSGGSFETNGDFFSSKCPGDDCLTLEEFLSNSAGGAYNLLSVYAYAIFKIQDFKDITVGQKVNRVIDIASKLTFGIVFFIIFGILVIAIVYALFTRAIMLWMYAIFSPLFALTYVTGWKKGVLDKFTPKEFIALAMVPVFVSAALAFGLMFLGLVMNATSKGTTGGAGGDGTLGSENRNITTTGDTTVFTFGDVKLTTVGLLTSENTSGISGVLNTGKGIIGTIIINVLALVVLWMVVMAALGASKITEAAVAPIHSFGKSIGDLAKSAPQYIPIPLPGKDKSISMAGMGSIVGPIKNSLDNMSQQQGSAIGKQFAPKGDTLSQKAIDLQTKTALNMSEAAIYTKDMLSAGKSEKFALNNNARGVLAKHLDSLNNYGGFDNKENATKLIKALGDSTNALEIRNILSKLDGLSESKGYGSLIGGQGKILEGDIDTYIGKGEKITENITATPINITDKTTTNITVNGKSAAIVQVDTKIPFTADSKMTITKANFDKLVSESNSDAKALEEELKKQHIDIKK